MSNKYMENGIICKSAQSNKIQSFKHVGAPKSLAGSFRWVLGLPEFGNSVERLEFSCARERARG